MKKLVKLKVAEINHSKGRITFEWIGSHQRLELKSKYTFENMNPKSLSISENVNLRVCVFVHMKIQLYIYEEELYS